MRIFGAKIHPARMSRVATAICFVLACGGRTDLSYGTLVMPPSSSWALQVRTRGCPSLRSTDSSWLARRLRQRWMLPATITKSCVHRWALQFMRLMVTRLFLTNHSLTGAPYFSSRTTAPDASPFRRWLGTPMSTFLRLASARPRRSNPIPVSHQMANDHLCRARATRIRCVASALRNREPRNDSPSRRPQAWRSRAAFSASFRLGGDTTRLSRWHAACSR